MVTMVVMVTVAKAKKYCINSKIGTQATIIIREPEKQKTFTLAVFLHFKGNHKSQWNFQWANLKKTSESWKQALGDP